MSDNQLDAGRIPRSVDCELTRDLVDSCIPGDVVTTAGTVKVNSANEGRGRSSDKCMFLLYVHANSVTNAKNSVDSSGVVMDIGNQHGNTTGSVAGGSGEGGRLTVEFSLRELYAVQHIHSNANLFRLIVASLCPSIYGHEMVKAGLVLALFGSDRKFANDKNRIPVRGDPHILVVGDPGLGKSQVTLSKEPGSGGDFALEAGALVLADQGCCCIDEFDKMGTQHQALLEAMEQQSISIAKAGIVCSLPARTSILAAANPSGGHYNKAKSVSENLRMGSALLSRFDLVFIMLDRPDEEMDNLLSEHVMALHAGKKKMNSTSAFMKSSSMLPDSSRVQWEADKPVCEKLKVSRGCFMDLIPHEMLRKYIGYSRMYVRPKIGSDAAKVLQRFYLELRKLHRRSDGIPITTRQLESLIRLTEARARLELREVATGQDAEEVVEIMKFSMLDVFRDQFGLLDFHRSQHGSGMSGRSKPKKFIAALQRVAEQTCNSIFTVKQMQQLVVEMGFQLVDFEDFLNSLNTHGFLLKKGPKIYELQTFGK